MTVEVRGDYISREQVLKKLQALEDEYHKEFLRNDTSAVYEMNMWGRMHGIEKVRELVLELPSVELISDNSGPEDVPTITITIEEYMKLRECEDKCKGGDTNGKLLSEMEQENNNNKRTD